MEKERLCGEFEKGIAYKRHLPENVGKKAIGEEYMEEEGLTLCEVSICPYGNLGEKLMYSCDSEKGVIGICNSNGLIKKIEILN